jgi:hypothetical protein
VEFKKILYSFLFAVSLMIKYAEEFYKLYAKGYNPLSSEDICIVQLPHFLKFGLFKVGIAPFRCF